MIEADKKEQIVKQTEREETERQRKEIVLCSR